MPRYTSFRTKLEQHSSLPRESAAGTTRPSAPSFDLQRSPYTSKLGYEEFSKSSIHYEGFDDVEVLPPKFKTLFTECRGKKSFTLFEDLKLVMLHKSLYLHHLFRYKYCK